MKDVKNCNRGLYRQITAILLLGAISCAIPYAALASTSVSQALLSTRTYSEPEQKSVFDSWLENSGLRSKLQSCQGASLTEMGSNIRLTCSNQPEPLLTLTTRGLRKDVILDPGTDALSASSFMQLMNTALSDQP